MHIEEKGARGDTAGAFFVGEVHEKGCGVMLKVLRAGPALHPRPQSRA